MFRVVGDKVIVPRKKGQRVRVGRKGEIEVARKVGGKMRRGKFKQFADLGGPGKVFLLPFKRGTGIEWMKFDSRAELDKFMLETSPKAGQTYKNYAAYILELEIEEDTESGEYVDTDKREEAALERQLELQLARRRRARKRRAARRRK